MSFEFILTHQVTIWKSHQKKKVTIWKSGILLYLSFYSIILIKKKGSNSDHRYISISSQILNKFVLKLDTLWIIKH